MNDAVEELSHCEPVRCISVSSDDMLNNQDVTIIRCKWYQERSPENVRSWCEVGAAYSNTLKCTKSSNGFECMHCDTGNENHNNRAYHRQYRSPSVSYVCSLTF